MQKVCIHEAYGRLLRLYLSLEPINSQGLRCSLMSFHLLRALDYLSVIGIATEERAAQLVKAPFSEPLIVVAFLSSFTALEKQLT